MAVAAVAVPAAARLPALPGLRLTRATALPPALALPFGRALPLPLVGLAAVELGPELVAATLPALGDLLDGVAHRLEPVQLPRPGTPRRGRAALGGLA